MTLDPAPSTPPHAAHRGDPPEARGAGAKAAEQLSAAAPRIALLSGISALALLAASFVVGCTITTAIAARRRELGLVRCIGGRRAHVRRLVMGEALLAGLVGTAIGVPAGLVLARLLLDTATESTALVFNIRTFTRGLDVTPVTLVLGAVAGLATAAIASVAPARDAATTSPLVAVREPYGVRAGAWPPWPLVAGAATSPVRRSRSAHGTRRGAERRRAAVDVVLIAADARSGARRTRAGARSGTAPVSRPPAADRLHPAQPLALAGRRARARLAS